MSPTSSRCWSRVFENIATPAISNGSAIRLLGLLVRRTSLTASSCSSPGKRSRHHIVTAIEESFHQTCSDALRGAGHNHCFVDIWYHDLFPFCGFKGSGLTKKSQRTETFPPFTSLTSGVMTTESPSFNPCLTSIPVSVVKPQTTLTRRTIPSRTVQT